MQLQSFYSVISRVQYYFSRVISSVPAVQHVQHPCLSPPPGVTLGCIWLHATLLLVRCNL